MTNPEHLAILKQDGIEHWNKWKKELKRQPLHGISLRGAHLGNMDLRGRTSAGCPSNLRISDTRTSVVRISEVP